MLGANLGNHYYQQFFYYNFDKIDRVQHDTEQDKVHRSILREETKRMVEGDK